MDGLNSRWLRALLVLPVLLALALALTLPGDAEAVHREKEKFIRSNFNVQLHTDTVDGGVWVNVNGFVDETDGVVINGFVSFNVNVGDVGFCGFFQQLFDFENNIPSAGPILVSGDIDAGTVILNGTATLEGDCGLFEEADMVLGDLTLTATTKTSKFSFRQVNLNQSCRARGEGFDADLSSGTLTLGPDHDGATEHDDTHLANGGHLGTNAVHTDADTVAGGDGHEGGAGHVDTHVDEGGHPGTTEHDDGHIAVFDFESANVNFASWSCVNQQRHKI